MHPPFFAPLQLHSSEASFGAALQSVDVSRISFEQPLSLMPIRAAMLDTAVPKILALKNDAEPCAVGPFDFHDLISADIRAAD